MTARAARNVVLTCRAGCGYRTAKPTTRGLARHGLRMHSCARYVALAERADRAQRRAAAIDRTPKPCLHKQANHHHGTNAAYHLDACRCAPCRVAATGYDRTRTRQTAYGQWRPFVDAEPARMHVRELMAAGMGLKRITGLSGVGGGVLCKLIYGAEGRPPSRQVKPETADKLLAVELQLAAGARVDAAPTWRLIHGLIALGYPKSWVAQHLDQRSGALQLSDRFTTQARADTVRGLAARYGATRGPSERARQYAAARGWTADLLWQDVDAPDETDLLTSPRALVDEVAVDRACAGVAVNLNRAERLEAVRRLRALRIPTREIARRLHLHDRQVHRDIADIDAAA